MRTDRRDMTIRVEAHVLFMYIEQRITLNVLLGKLHPLHS